MGCFPLLSFFTLFYQFPYSPVQVAPGSITILTSIYFLIRLAKQTTFHNNLLSIVKFFHQLSDGRVVLCRMVCNSNPWPCQHVWYERAAAETLPLVEERFNHRLWKVYLQPVGQTSSIKPLSLMYPTVFMTLKVAKINQIYERRYWCIILVHEKIGLYSAEIKYKPL